jgi:succinate dehydrogenase / fumarate reductase cytochrome b subunit
MLLVGILGTVFHAANGLWSGAILWKAIKTPESKARLNYICFAFGLALATMGSLAWYAFTMSPNAQAALTVAAR